MHQARWLHLGGALIALGFSTFAGCSSDRSQPAARASAAAAQAPAPSAPPTPRQDIITDQFIVPDGMEVTLWAQTPQLFNPTNIDVDSRGRLYVAEGVNYRETWKPQHALQHPAGDRIMILEDTDGDGVADSSKVFAQDKDLICPLGVAVLGNQVVVSCSPNLIIYTDTDGDDKADKKEIFLTGFGGKDHDHGLHSVVGGLDGKWYFNAGNDGPHEVTDKSGWHLHSGSCYVYGPTGNTGNRVSDDGRVWTGGIALRVDPDGTHLTPLAHNFRNSYEIARDSFGSMWQSDNDDDGNRGCRFSWVMEGGNAGYFSADGTRFWGADKRPGQETITAHWHQDDPGVVPLGDNTGAGGPTGVVVYEGGQMPAALIGCVFDADAGRNRVWIHKPVSAGAGYTYERSTLIEAKIPTTNASERANWFRPSDVAVGTDGAIYIADWYDPGVGGHAIGDKQAQGRILRLAPRGSHGKAPRVDLDTLQGQLAALNNPAVNIRYAAAMNLRRQPAQAIPKLKQMLREGNAIGRARALGVLAQFGDRARSSVEPALSDGDPNIRIAAFRALRGTNSNVLAHAAVLANDPSPAVRREVAIALRDVPLAQCQNLLLTLARGYDGADRAYLEAFGIACDRKEDAIYPLLLDKLGSGDPLHWSDAMTGLAWRLHPRASLDAFVARAKSPTLSSAAHLQALTAIAFIKDEQAAVAMDQLRTSGPSDVKPVAQWWLKTRGGNDWKDFAVARNYAVVAASEDSAKTAHRDAARREADLAKLANGALAKGERERAAVRLAGEREGAMMVIAMAAEKKFPAELMSVVADAISRNPDLSIRAMAGTYFPRKTAAGVALPPIKDLARLSGDASRGRAVFFGNAASCSRCHAFNGEGKDIGPDLTAIRTKFQRPELLDAILNPSASIAFGYEPWIVQTTDGQVYSGFIQADGETVVMKESTGEQRRIPKSKIKKRVKQSMSVMPDNVALGLTAQELADVAEFLLKSPVTATKTK
jgi:putative membrane-bound dehydrogenase-like protein